MRGARRGVGALAAAALVLSGCAKPAPEKAGNPLAEQTSRFKTMSPRQIAEQTAQLSYDMERPLLTFAGLEAKLGGEQATNAALLRLMRAYKARAIAIGDDVPRLAKASWEAHVGDGMGALGAGYMVTTMALIAAATVTESGSQTLTHDGGTITVGIDGDRASVDSEMEVSVAGLTGKAKTKAVADLCPDPAGRVHVSLTVDSSQTDGAGSGANTVVTVDVNRYFGDDARFDDRLDYDGNVRQSAFEKGKGSFVDVSLQLDTTTGTSARVNAHDPAATSKHVEAAQAYIRTAAALAYFMLGMSAEERVERGTCVNLNTSTDPEKRTRADPGTRFTIEAMPRAKSDGAMAAGTVVATLQGEGALFEAGQKKRADARFVYTAPGQKDRTGQVVLESRSRRGVGKATVAFNTHGTYWRTTGGAVLLWPGGGICDINAPFTFTDGQTTTVFTPTGGGPGGTFGLKTRQPFGSGSGSGTYRIVIAPDGRSGTLSVKGRVVFTVAGHNSPAAPIATDYPLEPAPALAMCH